MRKRYILMFISVLLLSCSLTVSFLNAEDTKVFTFDREDAVKEWQEKVFQGKVIYTVEEESRIKKWLKPRVEGKFLMAESKKTASGLFYRVKFHPRSKPMISWKWRVNAFPDKGKAAGGAGEWVEQDDYAARFYVIFPRFPFTLTECIEYIWDEHMSEGTIKESPYFKNIKLFVIESGDENLGKWVFEERNIYEDYKAAFGRPPERSVGAIAIMTDSDNTLSTAEASYDEIYVGYSSPKVRSDK